MTGEFELISKLRQQLSEFFSLPVGAGVDDAAVLPRGDGSSFVIATDMLLGGVHFDINEEPGLIGRKALAVNLSDIAAMGAVPQTAVVSVALPRGFDAESLHDGLFELARECDVPVVGGDTNVWEHPLAINVAVTGALQPGEKPFLRSGAQVGDWILATGAFGGSLAGHHLTFKPRVQESRLLRELCDVHAMIDVSDGLAADLHHILRESAVGAVVDETLIPISAAAQDADDGRTPLDHALADGEDFELLLTVSAEDGEWLLDDLPEGLVLHRIGEIVDAAAGCTLERSDKSREPLLPSGWEHR